MPVAPASQGRTSNIGQTDRGYELFQLWCDLTRRSAREVPIDEVAAFLGRPELGPLSRVPDEVLRDAAGPARRGTSLPLERWLATVRIVRPHA